MAILSRDERKHLPADAFAIKGRRAYPIHDLDHARNALTRVSQFGTEAERVMVRAAVRRRYPQLSHPDLSK